jgi:hypothetical protein
MPTAAQRQVACTHLNVTRLFDAFDSHKCQMCGRASSLGWVYRCTQDSDSFLPKSDFSGEEPESCGGSLSDEVPTSHLSRSILRGIQDGNYDVDQIQLLQAQKLRVKEVIALQHERRDDHSDCSHSSSSSSSSDSALDNSIRAASKISGLLTRRNTNVCSQAAMNRTAVQIEADSVTSFTPNKSYTEPVFPECNFKCCHSCRPAYRDRAFQSLNAIAREPFIQPPLWELENRRISDANLLTTIATPYSPLQLRRVSQTLDNLRDLTGPQNFGSSENEDVDSMNNAKRKNARRRSGFRETVRKALGAIEQSKRTAKSSQHSSRSSSRESFVQMSRSMLFRRRRKQADKPENQIVSNKALQESLVLILAVNTPLPRASEDSDSSDGGEVQVEDGIAVTEEGVGMSAADIIMQV